MYYRLFISIIAFFCSITLNATVREISLWGHIKDSFTNAGIYNVTVTLMSDDSVAIDSQKVQYYNEGKTYMDSYYRFKVPSVAGKYIIRATHADYDTCYVAYEVKYVARNTYFDVPTHRMKRRLLQGDELGEVVIKATKVKFFHKNDTLTYNADSFVLPNGSMLDDLIRQLPGAKLTSDGEILINGRKVDELLLHGERFFSKGKRYILKNMPSYVIKKIKVYEKTSDKDKYIGSHTEQEKYVMDLQLKKEHAKGYIANAALGYGSQNRHIGRLFGLRYTPHSRLSLFGNTNNIREYLRPGSDGEWRIRNIDDMQLSTKYGGMEYFWSDKEERIKNTTQIGTDYRLGETDVRKVSENYLSKTTNLVQTNMYGNYKDIYLYADNSLTIKSPLYIWMNFGGTYRKSDGNSFTQSQTSRFYPTGNDSVLNRHMKHETGNGYRAELYENFEMTGKLPWGDHIGLTANATYRTSRNSTVNHHHVNYELQKATETRALSATEPAKHFFLDLSSEYTMHFLSGWNLSAKYGLEEEYDHEINDIYRLDRFLNDTLLVLNNDVLPSERDSVLMAFDASNSFSSTLRNWRHKGTVHTYYQKDKIRFDASLQCCYNIDDLHYSQSDLDTIVSRYKWLVKPSVSFKLTPKQGRQIDIRYYLDTQLPELRKTIPVSNTKMPLVTYLGNNRLKSALTHNMGVSYRSVIGKKGFYNYSVNATLYRRRIGNALKIDEATGAYTYQPQNIDGNYQIASSTFISVALDQKKLWTFDNELSYIYNRSVDFVSGSTASFNTSKADNMILDESMKVSWQKGLLHCSILAKAKWHKQKSKSDYSRDVSVIDTNYGASITCLLPWKCSLSTDIRYTSLHGYCESSYNDNYLIWNFSFKKACLNDRLNIGLDSYDLFHQLPTYRVIVNAQGREEKFSNVITNFFMLTINYKFQKNP